MIYIVDIDGQDEVRVELTETERGRWQAQLPDGETLEMTLHGRDADGSFVLEIGGERRTFHLDKNCSKFLLAEGDEVMGVNVENAGDVILDHQRYAAENSAIEVDVLESPITGVVLDILVEPGQHVEQGDPVVIIEAMKMENTLNAPAAGTVDEVFADEGATVYQDDALLKIR